MMNYHSRSLKQVLFVLVLVFSAQVQASFFDYPRDASYSVIEYTLSHDMIRNADPQPMLQIFGDGRVHVHYPVYMKRAGNYQMYLSDTEIQQLLGSLEQKGILKITNKDIVQIKKQANTIKLGETNGLLIERSDISRSKFKVNLDSYVSDLSVSPQYDFKQEVILKSLKFEAQANPSITEIQNAAHAEQELRNFLTHRDLIKIQ